MRRLLCLALAIPALAVAAETAKPVKQAEAPKEKKYYLVEEELLQAVMQYMASRPYQETFQLIPALQQAAKPFVKEDVCKAK